MDTQHFKRIRTFKDIKVEKARLRYEMLVAENALLDSFSAVESIFTFSSIWSRITQSYDIAKTAYHYTQVVLDKIMFWRQKSKKGENC